MVSFTLQMPASPAHDALRMAAPARLVPEPQEITLRVSGGKPLRFDGLMMIEATSWSPSVPTWHEVALYRTAGTEWAASVRVLKKPIGETDIHHAELFVSVDDALNWLEAFDPIADLSPNFDASDRRVSTAEIALLSASLRQHADAVTKQWRGLIGELLYRFAQTA
jgi:hypothetical protein